MIRLLDKNTISQIAAGEVVERPLNIVKELLENAIDAGSTRIIINIEQGGIKRISINDNGSGISQDDLPLAFKPHATSKIQNIDDILKIGTFGFRGEALASIGTVSKATIITKKEDDINGYKIVDNFGEISEIEIVASTNGTNVIIEDLFEKIPVRKKFLKSPSVEANKIMEIVEKIALSHKEISFKYISDGRERFATAGDNNLKNIIYTLYGKEIYNNVIPIDNVKNNIKISGLIAMPIISRNKRDDEIFFVNNRYITNNVLYKAVEDAYSPYLMQHKYPLVVLNINMNGSEIDVNVHPQKMQVKFANSEIVYSIINETVSNALKNLELIHTETFDDSNEQENFSTNITKQIENINQYNKTYNNPMFNTDNTNKTNDEKVNNNYDINEIKKNAIDINSIDSFSDLINNKSINDTNNNDLSNFEGNNVLDKNDTININIDNNVFVSDDKFIKSKINEDYKYIGQVFKTYILIEYKDKLYIIDQHAAHEKVYYERYIKELDKNEIISQKIIPIVITLTPTQFETVKNNLIEFNKSGFSIDLFGEKEIIVDAVPFNILKIGKKELLLEMIDDFTMNKGITGYNSIKDKIATIACKKAVKGNNELTKEEAIALINELFTCDNPYNCPHGRPTIIEFSNKELEKKFGRIVS